VKNFYLPSLLSLGREKEKKSARGESASCCNRKRERKQRGRLKNNSFIPGKRGKR